MSKGRATDGYGRGSSAQRALDGIRTVGSRDDRVTAQPAPTSTLSRRAGERRPALAGKTFEGPVGGRDRPLGMCSRHPVEHTRPEGRVELAGDPCRGARAGGDDSEGRTRRRPAEDERGPLARQHRGRNRRPLSRSLVAGRLDKGEGVLRRVIVRM